MEVPASAIISISAPVNQMRAPASFPATAHQCVHVAHEALPVHLLTCDQLSLRLQCVDVALSAEPPRHLVRANEQISPTRCEAEGATI